MQKLLNILNDDYQKPTCDCGCQLKVKKIKHYREDFNFFTLPLKLVPKFMLIDGVEWQLVCFDCKKVFEMNKDKYGHIVRSNEISK